MNERLALGAYLSVFRKRWLIVMLCIAACALLAAIWSILATRVYASETRVLINNPSPNDLIDPSSVTNSTNLLDRQLRNEARFVVSDEVQQAADAILHEAGVIVAPGDDLFDAVRISTSHPRDTDELTIRAQALSAEEAMAIATVYTDTYLSLRENDSIADVARATEVIQRNIDQAQSELDELGSGDDARRRVLESQLASYEDARRTLNLGADLRSGAGRLTQNARLPEGPFTPDTQRNIALGVFAGAMLGLGLTRLTEAMDKSVTSIEDVAAIDPELTTLATIPAIRDWRDRDSTRVITVEHPKSEASDAYAVLRGALEFAAVDHDVKVIQVTSSGAGEGKSTTAANLAVSLARAGREVTLVDGDLRKPRLAAFFGIENDQAMRGLTSLILNKNTIWQAKHIFEEDVGSLAVIASGPLPPGPSELLGSARSGEVIKKLADECDILIIDSPPVMDLPDALVIAQHVDATIVVANATRTRAPDLEESLRRLDQVDATVLGVVLNQVKLNRNRYGYGYGYGEESE